jgi:ATP-dependent Clp protease ATP-binding subunit ClpB
MNIFNKFTIKAQEALQYAQEIAASKNQGELKPVHLLYALSVQDSGIVSMILEKMNVNISEFVGILEREINQLPKLFSINAGLGQLYLSHDLLKILEHSGKECSSLKDEFISCEHLFLGILMISDELKMIFSKFNIRREMVLETLKEMRDGKRVTDEMPESRIQVLEKYSINLTRLAREKKLDPLIGREEELRRVIQIISRRTKNNPVLVGEPGVGKTAIVEGLAQRIVSGDIPECLKGKEVLSLDLAGIIAGTKYRGDFEARIKSFIKEIQANKDKYILFIDEIHTIVGAGASEGSTDAANILKPTLAKGELRAIGATTLKEFQKYFEKDTALERRFQQVLVEEPNISDAISILRGLKEKYEIHHGIKISDNAVISSVNLSSRYISDRFLPDKAVDLIDEAASSLRLSIDVLPPEVEVIKKKILDLEIEKQSLKKEKDRESISRMKIIDKDLKELRLKNEKALKKVQKEKDKIQLVYDLRKELDNLNAEAEIAEHKGNLEKTAKLLYGDIPEIKKKLKLAQSKLDSKKNNSLEEEVKEEDIAKIVARWTGVPVSRMLEDESQKLIKMEEIISQRVIGQKKAIKAVSDSIKRSRVGIADSNKPIGSFMFLGPTGVGKTELAKALAEFMFNDEKAIIRVDMSEYMERHTISKIIGAPPGYVGYEEGGQLTQLVRRKPYSVVLFDEIEKAHPEVFNILLQILDEGTLKDAKGRLVNFKNTIIIMTSNSGSDHIRKMSEIGFKSYLNDKDEREQQLKLLKDKIRESLKENFKPEFINRIDEIIMFDPLSKEDIRNIAFNQINLIKERLNNKGIEIELDKKAENYLVENGYSQEYGARELKRLIQKSILDSLAGKMINGNISCGDKIFISEKENEIVFENKRPIKILAGKKRIAERV